MIRGRLFPEGSIRIPELSPEAIRSLRRVGATPSAPNRFTQAALYAAAFATFALVAHLMSR